MPGIAISQSSQESTCSRASFLIKFQAEACSFNKKESLAELFSYEFWEISKNTFSYKTPPVAASEDAIFYLLSLHKKWSFPSSISSVNVAKSGLVT